MGALTAARMTLRLDYRAFVLSRADSNRGGGFASGFVVGGAVFGTLGFLFAPQVSSKLKSLVVHMFVFYRIIKCSTVVVPCCLLGANCSVFMQISRAILGQDQKLRLPKFLEEEEKSPEATKQVGLGLSGMRVLNCLQPSSCWTLCNCI